MWVRSGARHRRNTIAHSSCCTHLHKIFATLTKQPSRLILDPVLSICVDLGCLRGSVFAPLGLTFKVLGVLGTTLGTTLGHQKGTWGHPGAPSQQDTKNNAKKHFSGDLFWDQI